MTVLIRVIVRLLLSLFAPPYCYREECTLRYVDGFQCQWRCAVKSWSYTFHWFWYL